MLTMKAEHSETARPVQSSTATQQQHLRQAEKTTHFALKSLCTLLDAYALLLRQIEASAKEQGNAKDPQPDTLSTIPRALGEVMRRQN